jgi:predicted phage terminase large subunit-like protein
MFLNPIDNSHNLTPEFLASLEALPEKSRKRFYEGLYVDEIEGALWSYELIEEFRRTAADIPEEKRARVVVAVDPSGASGKEDSRSDEIGICVAAKGQDGHAYVLADLSLRAGPAEWARAAVNAFHAYRADAIVTEQNFGGEMVRSTILAVDQGVPVKLVTASRGKFVRAEPISALASRGWVHHVGRFSVLEDQLCGFSSSGYTGSNSPDHADAMIWAISDLCIEPDNFANAMRTMELLYSANLAPATGDALIDRGIWKPKQDDGQRVRLRVPAGISTVYGGHTGRRYQIDGDNCVDLAKEDADHMALRSWERIFVDA